MNYDTLVQTLVNKGFDQDDAQGFATYVFDGNMREAFTQDELGDLVDALGSDFEDVLCESEVGYFEEAEVQLGYIPVALKMQEVLDQEGLDVFA